MPSPAENARTPLEALYSLVHELFDAAEFRRWLHYGSYADVLAEIPGESAPFAEVVHKALGALERREQIDFAFFDGLKRERAGKRAVIEAVQTQWFGRTFAVANSERASSSASADPFWTAGTMPADHETYVRRSCEQELVDTLQTASFIAVEGPSEIGKSSLVRRVAVELGTIRRFSRVDVDILRYDDEKKFMAQFFEQISDTLERPVSRWTDIVDEIGPPMVVVLDEFGFLSSELVRSIVPALYGLAQAHPGRVQVVACFPSGEIPSLVAFLRQRGLSTNKYCDCWRQIRVPPFSVAEVEQLFVLLPPSAGAVARAERDTIMRLSGGSPLAVQRSCSKLYAAVRRGVSDGELRALLKKKEAYR